MKRKRHFYDTDPSTTADERERKPSKFESLRVSQTDEDEHVYKKMRHSLSEGRKSIDISNFSLGEEQLVAAIKPAMSKKDFRNANIKIEDCKDILLQSMYLLGKSYASHSKYANNHAKAIAIFNYCEQFAQKYEIEHSFDLKKEAFNTEIDFLKSINAFDRTRTQHNFLHHTASIAQDKELMNSFRNWVKATIKRIANSEGESSSQTIDIETLNQVCTEFFTYLGTAYGSQTTNLISELMQRCFNQLGRPPEGCEFALLGLGSLAGGKMTPYSDLEFVILINEEKEEYKKYFRNLTNLLHFKILNLGESPLRGIGVDSLNDFKSAEPKKEWFWDVATMPGIRYDGAHWHACKLPLGRKGYKAQNDETTPGSSNIIEKPDFELIHTPRKMTEFQGTSDSDEPGSSNWFESDPYLVQGLRSTRLIYGSIELHKQYTRMVDSSVSPCVRQKRATHLMRHSLDSYKLNIFKPDNNNILDVKKDIYRAGESLITAIAEYFGIRPTGDKTSLTVWEKIDAMLEGGFISAKGAANLREAINIATELRLQTYCHHNGQIEDIRPYIPDDSFLTEEHKKKILKEVFYLENPNKLYRYYYIVISLQNIVREFLKHKDEERFLSILKDEDFYDDSPATAIYILSQFMNYEEAAKILMYKVERPGENSDIKKLYWFLREKLGNNQKIHFQNRFLEFSMSEKGKDVQNIKTKIENQLCMANAYLKYGDVIESICTLFEIKNMALSLGLSNLGMHKYAQIIFKLADALLMSFYPSESLAELKDFNKMLKINLAEEMNNKEFNLLQVETYIRIGRIHLSEKQQIDAERAIESASSILDNTFPHVTNHLLKAEILTCMSNISLLNKQYETALSHAKQCCTMQQAILGTDKYPMIIESCMQIAKCYIYLKNQRGVEKYLKHAKLVMEEIYKYSPDHPEQIPLLIQMAELCSLKGDANSAITNYFKALKITQNNFGEVHLATAKIHEGIADIYSAKKDHGSAIDVLEKSLMITKKYFSHIPDHPRIKFAIDKLENEKLLLEETYDFIVEMDELNIPLSQEHVKSDNHFISEAPIKLLGEKSSSNLVDVILGIEEI